MMATRDPFRARPFIRVLAGVLVAAGLFAAFLGTRQFIDKRDAWSGLVLYTGLLMAFAMGHVMLTGRWLWRLPDERRQDRHW
jgi:hypothetical protein